MFVCMYIGMYIHFYVCPHVRMYPRMYVRMYLFLDAQVSTNLLLVVFVNVFVVRGGFCLRGVLSPI